MGKANQYSSLASPQKSYIPSSGSRRRMEENRDGGERTSPDVPPVAVLPIPNAPEPTGQSDVSQVVIDPLMLGQEQPSFGTTSSATPNAPSSTPALVEASAAAVVHIEGHAHILPGEQHASAASTASRSIPVSQLAVSQSADVTASPTKRPVRLPTKINRMVIEGFKSFGRRTEFIFGDKFNTVLGPNGSGKSNILDAVCFVLGKSSSKQLRAEKSENLIYNGGKTKQPAKQAEVSIIFDNSSKVFPTPDEEVKLTRIVKLGGQGVYKINGKTRTRQEVLDLMSFAHIDPDGYNIVLQGDIVHFVEMSSIERRQIIEEIAGIGVYEEKKDQALNELSKVDEKLGQAAIILKEREGYLKDLRKDRDQALKWKELNDGIKRNKATVLHRQIVERRGVKGGFDGRFGKIKERFDKVQGHVKELRDSIVKGREEIKVLEDEVKQKSSTDQIALQKVVESLRVKLAEGKTRVSSIQDESSRIGQRKAQLGKSLDELEGKLGDLKLNQSSLQERLVGIEKDVKVLDGKMVAFRKRHNIDQDTQAIEREIEQFDKIAEEKAKDGQVLREKQQDFLRENDKIEYQLQMIDQQIAKVQELEDQHAGEIKALKQKKEEFKKAVLELNQLLNKDSGTSAELAQSRERLLKSTEELARFEVRQAQAQESMMANMAVKKVLENRRQLGGIHGTIVELGNVPAKYALALEVAAASRVQSIVTDEDKDAARCIKWLKENKFGIATFLPMNKVKPASSDAAVRGLAKERGVHGLAIDLITFDAKYKSVFSYVFGNTLVVDSIEVARRLGIGSAKMVTLDGDVAELSGAMVGGFRQRKQGVFKEQESSASLEKLQEDIADTQSRIARLEKERHGNEERITTLREFKANLEGDIIKTEKSLHIESGDLEASKQYKEELRKRSKEIEKQVDGLVNLIGDNNREVASAKIKRQELRTKILELRNPTVLAELNAFDEKKRQLSEDRIRVEAELRNVDMQMNELVGRDKDNTGKVLHELEKESESFKVETKTLESQIAQLAKELKA